MEERKIVDRQFLGQRLWKAKLGGEETRLVLSLLPPLHGLVGEQGAEDRGQGDAEELQEEGLRAEPISSSRRPCARSCVSRRG